MHSHSAYDDAYVLLVSGRCCLFAHVVVPKTSVHCSRICFVLLGAVFPQRGQRPADDRWCRKICLIDACQPSVRHSLLRSRPPEPQSAHGSTSGETSHPRPRQDEAFSASRAKGSASRPGLFW